MNKTLRFLLSLIVIGAFFSEPLSADDSKRAILDWCKRVGTFGVFGGPGILDGLGLPKMVWTPFSFSRLLNNRAREALVVTRHGIVTLRVARKFVTMEIWPRVLGPAFLPDQKLMALQFFGALRIEDPETHLPYSPLPDSKPTNILIKIKKAEDDSNARFRSIVRQAVSSVFEEPQLPDLKTMIAATGDFFTNYTLIPKKGFRRFVKEQSKLLAPDMITEVETPQGLKTYGGPEGYVVSYAEWQATFKTGDGFGVSIGTSLNSAGELEVKFSGTLYMKINGVDVTIPPDKHHWTEYFTYDANGKISKLRVVMNIDPSLVPSTKKPN